MNWKEYFGSRLISAHEAAEKVKSGDRVAFSHAAAAPEVLIEALCSRRESCRDVEIIHMLNFGPGEYLSPDAQPHFRHNSVFACASARDAINSGRADYTPCYFSLIPSLFTDGYLPCDVAFLHTSMPDAHGYVSMGLSVDYSLAALEGSKLVVAQVNKQMPRTHGDTFAHVSDIDFFVECDQPIFELPPAPLSDVERAIGKNCADLIEDGSTIQLGIGSLPDAVLAALGDKNDLGVHSEMLSDGAVALIESGVINNRAKTLHRGKAVVTFLLGTRKLYDFANDNPMFHMAPVNYVNDPRVIAQNNKMVSINACVQIDLMGQVASESIGLRQISAVGGQVDFVRGANMSPGGKSIIATQSTVMGGKASRIVPFFDQGTAVTTNRNDVRYVVTEYGTAQLFGKSLRERALALIEIAHPDFRGELMDEYNRRFPVY